MNDGTTPVSQARTAMPVSSENRIEPGEIDELLRELLRSQNLSAFSRWPFETARWYEFCASVLRVLGAAQTSTKAIENALVSLTRLGLLDLDNFTCIEDSNGAETPALTLIKLVLVRSGFGEKEARDAIGTIEATATFIAETCGGHVQLLLRRQGEAVLDNLLRELPTSPLDADTWRQIVAHWLQRALDLPIPVSTRGVRLAASVHHASLHELTQAADRLDINVGILDELLDGYEAEVVTARQR